MARRANDNRNVMPPGPGDAPIEEKQKVKVRVLKKYICVKPCFSGKQYFEPKADVYYTRRMIPDDILQNFKEIEVTEVLE